MSQQNFTVVAKDKASGREMKITVGRRPGVSNQEEAEVHIAHTMPRAQGGAHPGFEVTPADPEKFAKALAEAQAAEHPAQGDSN